MCGPTPPQVLQPLRDGTAGDGDAVTLVCRVCGLPQPTVTWQFQGKTLPHSDDFAQSYDGSIASLEISEAQTRDAGRYSLLAANSEGSARTECLLTITGICGCHGDLLAFVIRYFGVYCYLCLSTLSMVISINHDCMSEWQACQ